MNEPWALPSGESARTDLEALLASVVASPSDEAPRLVLSDWLEERGEKLAYMLRKPGQLYAQPSLTGRRVSSVLYWRVGRMDEYLAPRKLLRMGELGGFRFGCGTLRGGCNSPFVWLPSVWVCTQHSTRDRKYRALGQGLKSFESRHANQQEMNRILESFNYGQDKSESAPESAGPWARE